MPSTASAANAPWPRSSGSRRPPGEHKARAIVGAGGGKVLDTARAAAADLDLPVVNCPTVASSDAPCSALSVIYTDEGVFQEYRFYRKNPDLVLVDTQVIAQAPPRLLVAGMGDALATWFEARTCVAGHVKNMRGGGSTRSAAALAELCYGTLLEDGAAALRAVETQVVTPALERLVEANTLLSGLGFESSGLAAAHAVHNGLTVAPGTHAYLHGEKVAFGLLVQLVLEGSAPRRRSSRCCGFSTEVGLPITLAEIGLAGPARRPARPDRPPRHGPGRDDPQRAVRGHPRHGRRRHPGRRRPGASLEEMSQSRGGSCPRNSSPKLPRLDVSPRVVGGGERGHH